MAAVKWIKITTDMFDNRKIKHLRTLPDGNNIVLIWVMLLTMAGRCNAGGMIFLTENIPYTPKMLADELDFEESTVRLALEALEQLNMVRTDGFLTVAGWEEYQSTDRLSDIREYNRLAKQRSREKQKLMLADVNDKSMTSQCCQETEKEEENKNKNKRTLSLFISPSLADVQAYCDERQNGIDAQAFIDFYSAKGWMIGSNKMKDWKAAVRTWEKRRQEKNTLTPRQYNDVNIEF